MAFFVQLLANYAGLIYIGCVIGAAIYIRDILAARNDLQRSLYSLERESAGGRVVRGSIMIAVFGLIVIATYVLANVVAPQLPASLLDATPTSAFVLPTNTPTVTIQPTATRTATPATAGPGVTSPTAENSVPQDATPTSTTPSLPPVSCPDPNVQLTAPAPGQVVSGEFQLFGTADEPNFAFYKFTLKGPATGDVEQTAGDVVRQAKRNDVLGSIDPALLLDQPGVYILGLVVVDNTGNEYPHCTLPIIIQPPTPTP